MIKSGGSVTTRSGEERREQSQKTSSVFMKGSRNPISGYIIALRPAEGGDYYHQVKVRPDSSRIQSRSNQKISIKDTWLPLAEDPAVIAQLHGDKDLIIGRRCRIQFSDASPRTGRVFIEAQPVQTRKPRKQATEFDQKAFLYAIAGGGKLF